MLIQKFDDGSALHYKQGQFDEWCVSYEYAKGYFYAPRDEKYFQVLKNTAEKYGYDRVYQDFVHIYDKTGDKIEQSVLDEIESIAKSYTDHFGQRLDIQLMFVILYAAMVAEENKEKTKLGKRVKRHGVCLLLFEHKTPKEAANFDKGRNWREIAEMCEKYGF